MKTELRLFCRSLRNHPGIPYGIILPMMFFAAAVQGTIDKTSTTPFVVSPGSLRLAILFSLLIWGMITTTAWIGRQQYKD